VKKNDEAGALELVKASHARPQQAAPDFLLRKGDVPGHEFRGNQYGGGGGSVSTLGYAPKARTAAAATTAAELATSNANNETSHAAAASANFNAYQAHMKAARAANKAGEKRQATLHSNKAQEHYRSMQHHANWEAA
jgi:hypothetical protein